MEHLWQEMLPFVLVKYLVHKIVLKSLKEGKTGSVVWWSK
jgi:hypothetical protein